MENKTDVKEPPVKGAREESAIELFDDGTRSYVLHFRVGNRPPTVKYFLLTGGLQTAIDRARLHCNKMNFKFCGCYPMFVDLDQQEKQLVNEMGIGEY